VVGSHFDNLIFGKLQIAIVYATMFFQNVTPFYHNIYILKAIPRFYKKAQFGQGLTHQNLIKIFETS
jgi:hypothetical protein